jgi:hypothetical protein
MDEAVTTYSFLHETEPNSPHNGSAVAIYQGSGVNQP